MSATDSTKKKDTRIRKNRIRKKESVEYVTWKSMKGRCKNKNRPDYKNYGGRGITICERWSDFKMFLKDMGPRPSPNHSIDRIDNNGNYEPSNCRWILNSSQSGNRRTNKILEFNGQKMYLAQWAAKTGICRKTISFRLRNGWSVEDALTVPTMSMSEAGRKGNLSPKRVRNDAAAAIRAMS